MELPEMVTVTDRLDDAFHQMRRRFYAASAMWFVVTAIAIAPFWIAEPPPLEPYPLANVALFFLPAVLMVAISWVAVRQMYRSFEALRPRVEESGVAFGRAPAFTMDNGLFLQLVQGFAVFSLFLSREGSPIRATLEQARGWTGPFRWTRQIVVRAGTGAPDLAEIRDAVGASVGWAQLSRYRPKGSSPHAPGWVVTVAVGSMLFYPKTERIVREADRIAGYMRGFAQTQLPSVQAPPLQPPEAASADLRDA